MVLDVAVVDVLVVHYWMIDDVGGDGASENWQK